MIAKIKGNLLRRWSEESGYRQVLALAFPLILSTGSWSVQHFVDRMFLTWYSPEAIAASMPSGLLNYTVMSLFIGTASYVGTFVAQYYGAGRPDRIGPVIWQGIYVGLIGTGVMMLTYPFAGTFFQWIGHGPKVQEYETVFYRVLCFGAAPVLAAAAMSGFFSGLGKTWAVMWVNIVATAVTLVGDYILIFGRWGFPELGIKGAAIATVLSGWVAFGIYLMLFARPSYNKKYRLLEGWRFDGVLFKRLLYFGFPSGVQFFLDIAAFTVFLLLVGRLGTANLAATNIAFNINTLSFMPMIGFGIAVSVLVGQNLGKNRADLAEKSVYSGFHLTFFYMTTIALLYFFVPDIFVRPFAAQTNPEEFSQIREISLILLRFVAIYSVFDTMNIIFSSALRGAGDTRYVMIMFIFLPSVLFVLPSYIALVVLKSNLYVAWTIASLYIIILGFCFLFRFLRGKWKSMRVIEEFTPFIPPTLPESPIVDLE
jgi:multidrug resistance protein, MATE family